MAATEPKGFLRRRVMAAVAALLGATPITSANSAPVKNTGTARIPDSSAKSSTQASDETLADRTDARQNAKWTVETSFTQYNEADRIAVSEPQIGVRRDFTDERALTVLFTVDTISGSTPLGTLPLTAATAPDTVTGSSGKNPVIGIVPLSDMTDTRLALNTSYVGKNAHQLIETSVSKEHDFLSLGAGYTRNFDFNQKNTTLSLGLSPEFDIVEPAHGVPVPYAATPTPEEFERSSKTKYLMGGLVGLTQVINNRTYMQWNYSPTYENGYLTDPYKLLSLTNAKGDPLIAIHENRPGIRVQHSLYWLTRYNIRAEDVFSLGLRYSFDDWGIHSQTIDFTYRWHYHPRRFLEPHVRYYSQSMADFFHVGWLVDKPFPNFASADYRLSAIDSVTIGARVGWILRNGSELILRAEYYMQTGEDRPQEAVGAQRAFDLFPTLYASIVQVDYRFEPSRLFSKGSKASQGPTEKAR